MRLEGGIWLEGAYYIDYNHNDELRIVGPGNHLLLGSTGLTSAVIAVDEVKPAAAEEVQLKVTLKLGDGFLPDPAMGHIRKVRSLTQLFGVTEPTYATVSHDHPGELAPNQVTAEAGAAGPMVTYLRAYGVNYYGTRWQWPANVTLEHDAERRGFHVTAPPGPLAVTITTMTSVHPPRFHGQLWRRPGRADPLLERTAAEIEHLVSNGKTSGFDYGTVFPRDWIETADLLAPELTPEALEYLYVESLRHVSSDGAGWHEEVVGELHYEREQELAGLRSNLEELVGANSRHRQQFEDVLADLGELFVARHMIDIEPHYILGLRLIDPSLFSNNGIVRLRHVARYVVGQADAHRLITFKQLARPFRRQRGNEYNYAGNWRDSTLAFQKIDPVIAPFDVNAVLYPQALREIRRHHRLLGIDAGHVDWLITKWDGVKQLYRFINPDGMPAYALALYAVRDTRSGLRYQQLQVNHLDEAADLFYGEPSEADVTSFASRLLSNDYFRTPSGPTLVGHHDGYDHTQYHGDVIWAKQAALAAEGLARQARRGRADGWATATLEALDDARHDIAATCLRAFRELQAIPEMHYDDHGRPRLYTDQPYPEGQMNKVQLWSAAAARRLWANRR